MGGRHGLGSNRASVTFQDCWRVSASTAGRIRPEASTATARRSCLADGAGKAGGMQRPPYNGADATRCAGYDGHAPVKRPGQFTRPRPGRRGMVPLALSHRPHFPACLVLADQSAGCAFGHRPKRRLARWRAPTRLCVTPESVSHGVWPHHRRQALLTAYGLGQPGPVAGTLGGRDMPGCSCHWSTRCR